MAQGISNIARIFLSPSHARVTLSNLDVQIVRECLQKYESTLPSQLDAELGVADIRANQIRRIHSKIQRECPPLARMFRRPEDINAEALAIIAQAFPKEVSGVLAPPLTHEQFVLAYLDTGGDIYNLTREWEEWAKQQAKAPVPVSQTPVQPQPTPPPPRIFQDDDPRIEWLGKYLKQVKPAVIDAWIRHYGLPENFTEPVWCRWKDTSVAPRLGDYLKSSVSVETDHSDETPREWLERTVRETPRKSYSRRDIGRLSGIDVGTKGAFYKALQRDPNKRVKRVGKENRYQIGSIAQLLDKHMPPKRG